MSIVDSYGQAYFCITSTIAATRQKAGGYGSLSAERRASLSPITLRRANTDLLRFFQHEVSQYCGDAAIISDEIYEAKLSFYTCTVENPGTRFGPSVAELLLLSFCAVLLLAAAVGPDNQ